MDGGLLGSFFFMFTADTEKVKEGTDAGKKGAKELETSLMHTDQVAKTLGESFLNLAKGALSLAVGAIAVGAIKSMTVESAKLTNEVGDQAKSLRTNVEVLDTWQKAIVSSGGSAEGFNATLEAMKGRTRDPIHALELMSERFKGLDDRHADNLGKMLGIDPGTVEAMRGGAEGLGKLLDRQRMLGVVTKEQVDVARAYRSQLRDTNTVYDDIHRRIATQLLPAFTQWLTWMEKLFVWMRDKKFFILGFFGAIAGMVTLIYLPAIMTAIAATFAFLAPWLAIAAAFAVVGGAIALVYDDIMNFLAGNNSVIGELSKKWPIVGEAVHALVDSFAAVWDVARALGAWLIDVFTVGPAQALENFKTKIMVLLDALAGKFPIVGGMIRQLFNGLFAVGSGVISIFEGIWSVLSKLIGTALDGAGKLYDIGSKVAGFFGGGDGGEMKIKSTAEMGQRQLSTAGAHPLNSQTSNSISNSATKSLAKTTSVTVGSVTVNTQATDADGVAKSFNQSLSEQLKNAQDQFDDGVQS